MSSKIIHSVGIDVGTTTTQVIFSALELMNTAAPTQVPRFEFVDRKILYEGRIFFTPINQDGTIDNDKLWNLINEEYINAGFSIKEIETGAIIITGETSKAKNAKTTLMQLANDLGDFVVATAGPHLESIIAGRGSGSAQYSEEHSATVLNIDIGGGTSNYVVFNNGRVVDTCCLNVGGRLIQTSEDGKVVSISDPAKKILQNIFPDFNTDYNTIKTNELRVICDCMADMIVECAEETEVSPISRQLLMTNTFKKNYTFDAIFLSGGVGECYYNISNLHNDKFKYGDLGILLAESLVKNEKLKKQKVIKPKQTIRATVIGAGVYTLSLSGSTIWLTSDKLPLKNLPVIHPHFNWKDESTQLSIGIVEAAKRMDLDLSTDEYAIYLSKDMPLTYKAVQHGADELTKVYKKYCPQSDSPAIVLSYNDIGKALGMELEPRLRPRPLAIIDEVQSYEGDYIDIGKSYFGGEIVPLTVKSLAFP